MAQIDMSSGSASAYGAGELQLQNKAPMDGTLRFVTDSANTASPLKLSTSLVQTTSTLKITTSDVAYIDAEDNSGNNRFTVSRAVASQLVTVDFASLPTALTTPVGAIRTATDGVSLANVTTFLENGNIGMGTDSPASKLEVAGAGGVEIRVSASAAPAYYSSLVTNLNDVSTTQLTCLGTAIVQAGNSGDTVLDSRTTNTIFKTSGVERGRWTSSGLTFNGDTAAANALDDYEEGTWTPVLTGITTSPTVTYATQQGNYTKIGRQVTVCFEVGTSLQSGGVGAIRITGLPFTVGIRTYNCVATYSINNSTAAPMGIFAEVNATGSYFDLLATGDNTTWVNVLWTDALSATIYINGSFTYFV